MAGMAIKENPHELGRCFFGELDVYSSHFYISHRIHFGPVVYFIPTNLPEKKKTQSLSILVQ